MATVDYEKTMGLLDELYAEIDTARLHGAKPPIPSGLEADYDILFSSRTQAYRETLLGCILIKALASDVNVRLPYSKQGKNAYSGRTLDEKVVNPFLRKHKIPCSTGPYLNVFRRSVRFEEQTREGIKHKEGFDAFLRVIDRIERSCERQLIDLLRYHLHRFAELRETSHVEVARLNRISLEQLDSLTFKLLERPSGGRFPLFLVVSVFESLKNVFGLDWRIEFQGINVADKATGAGGDITIRRDGRVVLAAEVTERPVDAARMTSIFDTKIAPHSIEDYLFFIKDRRESVSVIGLAKQYFAQGHEVNFLDIRTWIVTVLSIAGQRGRSEFMQSMTSLLDQGDVPVSLKVVWNEVVSEIAAGVGP